MKSSITIKVTHSSPLQDSVGFLAIEAHLQCTDNK